MLKVWTDFNARTPDDECWILKYEGENLDQLFESLELRDGDKIMLFQDDDDFTVEAKLEFKFVRILQRNAWVAHPNWSTIVRRTDSRI